MMKSNNGIFTKQKKNSIPGMDVKEETDKACLLCIINMAAEDKIMN